MISSDFIEGGDLMDRVHAKRRGADSAQTANEKKPTGVSRKYVERTAALIAGVFAMLLLLISSLFSSDILMIMTGLTEPLFDIQSTSYASRQEALETPAATELSIRLADVDSDVSQDIVIQLMGVTAELIDSINKLDLSGGGPKILIYHTHNTEAYTQTDKYSYVESGDWRTNDVTRSVIAVGDELARILREDYGIEVIHDTTEHEPPLITTAYSRSLITMEYYKQLYPSLEMYIDLHRDAYEINGVNTDYAVIDGVQVARMMFVVGTGKGATGNGSEPLPDFESNYALAVNLTETLLSYNDHLMRKVRVKSGRYNQHVSNKCILVEVGHNANTLEEALAAMPYLARAIAEVAGITSSSGSVSFAP